MLEVGCRDPKLFLTEFTISTSFSTKSSVQNGYTKKLYEVKSNMNIHLNKIYDTDSVFFSGEFSGFITFKLRATIEINFF